MTVAVSVVAGVVGITSAIPALSAHAVALSVGFVALLTLVNLRGVQESGRLFAIPTYLFVSMTFVMFAVGLVKGIAGDLPNAATAPEQLHRTAHGEPARRRDGVRTEYVVGRWWEQALHNQSALRLKARLLFEPGVVVTSVPWQMRSAGRSAHAAPERVRSRNL